MERLQLKLAKITGKAVGNFSKRLRIGSGSVLPGRVALLIAPRLLVHKRKYLRKGCIFVTGTNGKSTTAYYISKVLENLGFSVVSNYSGANMQAGLASALLDLEYPVDYGVFEVDEASFPRAAKQLTPSHVLALNFSRDQLDRYAEIETIINRIKLALHDSRAELIYNYANLYSAILGEFVPRSVAYYVESSRHHKDVDNPVCIQCRYGVLEYCKTEGTSIIRCTTCKAVLEPHIYRTIYNDGLIKIDDKVLGAQSPELAETLTAASLLMSRLHIDPYLSLLALERTPLMPVHRITKGDLANTTYIDMLLGKNPDSFNRNLREVIQLQPQHLILAINNNFADGRDTSWLWDVQFELLRQYTGNIYVCGEAADDIALRLAIIGRRPQFLNTAEIHAFIARNDISLTIAANYTAYRSIEPLLTEPQVRSITFLPHQPLLKPQEAQHDNLPALQ